MPAIDYKEKLLGVNENGGKKEIVVSHITIRQSIFFLHLRLVALEIIAALGLILLLTISFSYDLPTSIGRRIIELNIPIFIFLVLIKLGFMIFIIVSWLNQYYEITPKDIIFRKGLIFKKEMRYQLKHIGEVVLEQGTFGRIFNFGTLKLFNWTTEKHEYLYLIHNPLKYQHILESLTPEADKGKKVLREHILELEEEEDV